MKNLNLHKFRIDLVLLFGMILLFFEKPTGHAIHEWTGVLVFLLLLWHLCLNWNWIANRCGRFFGKMPIKSRLNFIWNFLLYWTICVTVFSGILISRVFLPGIGAKIANDPFMSFVHHFLPNVLYAMIGVHLIVHYRWIIQCCSRYFGGRNRKANAETTSDVDNVSKKKLKFRTAVLFLVGVAMIAVSYPISQTSWADGVRENVQKIRAEKRRRREEQQNAATPKSDEKSSSAASSPELPETPPKAND